jgi:O-antigen ligase
VDTRWRPATLLFLVLALTFCVMLASKSGLLGLALVLLIVVVLVLRRSSGRSRSVTLGALAAAIIIPGYLLAPVIASRAGSAVHSVQRLLQGTADVYASNNGNDERLVAWICSTELIRNDAIGAGTGDIKHALVACYTAKGAVHAAERRLNSHSQFLQGGVALGWAGLLVALLVALVPLWAALRGRDLLLGVFMLLFILNAAIESVLEVQAGVVYFALFLGLLSARERSSSP